VRLNAKVAWHLYLMAQPAGLPERMIAAVAPEFFGPFLDARDTDGSTFTPEIRRHSIDSSVEAIDSLVADYRATASIDVAMDEADRAAGSQLTIPSVSSPRTGAPSAASTPRPCGEPGLPT
jgi:hypothetical protein